ncbi:MAG: hypothetical protein CMI32_02415 [Opitutales bacterium]|nr:hypothetical protein [Opitutales bacterium]
MAALLAIWKLHPFDPLHAKGAKVKTGLLLLEQTTTAKTRPRAYQVEKVAQYHLQASTQPHERRLR